MKGGTTGSDMHARAPKDNEMARKTDTRYGKAVA